MEEKICPKCSLLLPLNEYSKDKSRRNGHGVYCRICDFCRKHNINRNHWIEMVNAQGGHCAFPGCDAEPTEIDHNHNCCPNTFKSCGKCIRGALCRKHNMALGQFKDSVEQLKLGILYLESNG